MLCRSSRSNLAGRLTPPIGRRLLVRSRHGKDSRRQPAGVCAHPSASCPALPQTNVCHRYFCSAGSWAIASEHAKMLVGAAAAHAAARTDSSSTGTRSRLPLPTAVCTGCALGALPCQPLCNCWNDCGPSSSRPAQVVQDTLADARFRANPLVTSPRTALRFYAGAPLMSSDGSGAYGEGCWVWQGGKRASAACACRSQSQYHWPEGCALCTASMPLPCPALAPPGTPQACW